MKKIVLILCAAVLALMSCNKDLTPNEAKQGEPIDVVFNLSATHPGGGGTKAVKDAWETGDVVFVFFSGQTAPAYLELKYDGTKWVNTPKGLSFTEGETGTMTAVYLPFGSDATVEADGTAYKFDKTYYAYYLTGQLEYTVTDGEISGTFAMQIPEGYVQFFFAENPNIIYSEDWLIELREPHLTPMGVASISQSGDVATTSLAQGAPLPGYMYDKEVKGEGESKGFVFSGILSEDARNVGTDYHFTMVEGGWNGFYVSKTIEDKTLYRGPQTGRALNLLKDGWEEMEYTPIDLGMDIGGKRVYWADKNVGATSPDEYGDYFAWGATAPYYVAGNSQVSPIYGSSGWLPDKFGGYTWKNYPFMEAGHNDYRYINKYTIDDGVTDSFWYSGSIFTGDNLTSFADDNYVDDAARTQWGSSWRVPTDQELKKLLVAANYTWTWTDNYNGTGAKGFTVTSKISGYEGNQIFLPAAGYRTTEYLNGLGEYGAYWSSSIKSSNFTNKACAVEFDNEGHYSDNLRFRYYGKSIRPVSD